MDHTTQGEVVLVAHSFGGYLAQLYAHRHPERVRGIVFVDALDPAFGLLRGTGATDLTDVTMADERLDLWALETAAGAVTELPGGIAVLVLARERNVTSAWMEAQRRLAALAPGSHVEVVSDTSHQIPADAPHVVAVAVRRMLGGCAPVAEPGERLGEGGGRRACPGRARRAGAERRAC